GFLSLIDSTEQQIPRPENKERSKMYFSGKKKKHTVKTQLMVNNKGFIIHKTEHKKGHRHDYNIYRENRPVAPSQIVNVADLGYLGVEKDYPEQLSAIPCKKKRNQELSKEEIEYNKIHSKKKRIVIEYTTCRLKKYRIQSDVFRNKLRKYDRISDIVAGLVNYRILNQQN
ncbi:MAG: transposase family protein, partial [Thermoproteota archaeon]|nr:transposase family protein [Thermoproteota archaeon]